MTATKIDSIATKSAQSSRWCSVRDVQTTVPRVTRRCLFGYPDQDELQKICKSNKESERQRMLNTYGFDVKTEKYVGHGVGSNTLGDTKKYSGSSGLCNNNKKMANVKPYKQTCLTDYYAQLKKSKDSESKQNSLKQTKNIPSLSRKNVNKV